MKEIDGITIDTCDKSRKLSKAENQRTKRESILKEIEMKNKELQHAKKEKLKIKQLLSKDVDPEDPVYKEKLNKSTKQLNVYNQIMKDAQTIIKSKEAALTEIDGVTIDTSDDNCEIEEEDKNAKEERKIVKHLQRLANIN